MPGATSTRRYDRSIAPDWTAHETAIVEESATIGAGTRVWHHAHVRVGAVLGDECTISKGVFIDHDVVIGDRVKIQNNVSVYVGVTIEHDAFIGPSVVFTNDRFPRARSGRWTPEPTHVGAHASIGANATIMCGLTLGAYSLVGAGSVVIRDVEPHEAVAGNPAQRIGWVCTCGLFATRDQTRPADLWCPSCREHAHE